MFRRLLFLTLLAAPCALAATPYDIGSPVLRDVFVDPSGGSDSNSGDSRAAALRTLAEAWNRIPQGTALTTGYRIQLMAGTHPRSSVPVFMESRHGSAQFPVIIQSADGSRTAHVQGDLDIFDCRYVYLIGLDLVPSPPGDVVHFELCDHVLVRDCHLDGGARIAQETLKANQSQFLYVEDSDIHGAFDNAIDYVAVQFGHVINNRIHDAQDWCEYAKGGSAYLLIEGNEFFQCGTGGFTAGQGTGFQFMSPPWLQYEAYDIKVINNVVHDTEGAGLGVNGGYDILFAYNTLYRIGTRSHMFEAVFGARSCDGVPGDAGRERCQQYLNAGGWGTTVVDDGVNHVNIPNRHVLVFNNLIFNPAGTVSPQHITVAAPINNEEGTNAPLLALADDGLIFRGNVIVNDGDDTPLGVGDETGCSPSNATCNEAQIRAENAINAFVPQLSADYRPLAAFPFATAPIPSFSWSDAPAGVPPGTLANVVTLDRDGKPRAGNDTAGAYVFGTATLPSRRRAASH
jgi:Right handed beta helix region